MCKRNMAVNRVKLSTMKQDKGEPVRKFAGRVRSLAAVNGYTVKCTNAECGRDVFYTEAVIAYQGIAGLADTEGGPQPHRGRHLGPGETPQVR